MALFGILSNVGLEPSPISLLTGKSGLDPTSLLNNAATNSLAGLLGSSPSNPCPAGAGGSGGSASGLNDPCGKNNDALQNAALGLGLAAAGPAISEIGGSISVGLDAGLGSISSTIGDGVSSVATSSGAALGIDPNSSSQKVINSALGAGAVSAIGSGNAETTATNTLFATSTQINKNNSGSSSVGLFDLLKSTAGL